MPARALAASAAHLDVDRSSAVPLHRQVYDGLRAAILAGRLPPGARLPSSRALAAELGVARITVLGAYAQLLAEGYVEGRTGSGTFVAPVLPEELLQAREAPARAGPARAAARTLSRRGWLLAATPATAPRLALERPIFRPGAPAVDAFPTDVWLRLSARHWRRPTIELLGYGDPAGHRPLREAIAHYLGAARAVQCRPEQVIVVAGSQQGLDLAARVLLDPGDDAWIEDPGYPGARGALRAAGARLVPVPVDAEGLDIEAGAARSARPRLIYATPSHQYPLGVTMSLSRRLALLDLASRVGAWVLEDDYDSEFRYRGRPLAALQGLDREGRVIYLGTFSKVLFPGLRLGYVVAPPDLVEAFVAARALADRHSPAVEQAVLADFIDEGHFARHVRRMRTLYAQRQAALVEAARRELAGRLEVAPADAGLHLVGWLPEGESDRAAAQAAAAQGLDVPPLSAYRLESRGRGGLLLGYAAFDERAIAEGVRRLAAALGPLSAGAVGGGQGWKSTRSTASMSRRK